MKILFDTNVVLDLFLDLEPFSAAAELLFERVERGESVGVLCATTLTTVHYLVVRSRGKREGAEAVEKLLRLFEVAPVTRAVLESAIHLGIEDFEDAVLHQAACLCGCDGIVTRNGKDFVRAQISIYSPEELISTFRSREKGQRCGGRNADI